MRGANGIDLFGLSGSAGMVGSGQVGLRGQGQGAVAVPAISFQVVNQAAISLRCSSALMR